MQPLITQAYIQSQDIACAFSGGQPFIAKGHFPGTSTFSFTIVLH